MEIGEVTLELRRTGDTAKLKLMALKHGVEANVTLPDLEAFALYLASEVGRWRDELIEAELTTTHKEDGP